MQEEPTIKIYIVTFSEVETETGHKFTIYPIRVRAFDLDDAQEKAILSAESINLKHGSIRSITRSLSQY